MEKKKRRKKFVKIGTPIIREFYTCTCTSVHAHLVFPPNIRETWCRNIKGERRDKTANVFEKRSHQEEIYARRGDKFSR